MTTKAKAFKALEATEIQVKFETKLPAEFHVVNTAFTIPARLARMGLSEVLNHLLALEKPRPFDFLIDGELLRTSLAEYLSKRGLSTEKVLTLEYLLVPPKPTPIQDYPHEDWISSVSGNLEGFVLSGAFDGSARIWRFGEGDSENSVCAMLSGHTEAVTAVDWIQDGSASKFKTAITSSKDHTLLSWQANLSEEGAEEAVARFRYVGHGDSVSSVAACKKTRRAASGSWDKSVKIWGVPDDLEDGGADTHSGHSSKKQRAAQATSAIKDRGPLVTLLGHTQHVSSVQWVSQGEVVSGSWDHTIKIWDVETEVATTTLNGAHVVNSVSVAGVGSSTVIVSAHNDRLIRVWDPRVQDGAVLKASLPSHKGWVSSVAFLPESSIFFASASYDHSVRLWDVRAPVALHTLAGHEDKALCVGWAPNRRLLSGGADGKLRCFSSWDP